MRCVRCMRGDDSYSSAAENTCLLGGRRAAKADCGERSVRAGWLTRSARRAERMRCIGQGRRRDVTTRWPAVDTLYCRCVGVCAGGGAQAAQRVASLASRRKDTVLATNHSRANNMGWVGGSGGRRGGVAEWNGEGGAAW
jgi:hypothetical protein